MDLFVSPSYLSLFTRTWPTFCSCRFGNVCQMGAGAAPSASGAGVHRPPAGNFLHLPVERDIHDPHGPAGHTGRRPQGRSPDSRLNRPSGRFDFGDRNVFVHAHFCRGESPDSPNRNFGGCWGDIGRLVERRHGCALQKRACACMRACVEGRRARRNLSVVGGGNDLLMCEKNVKKHFVSMV